MTDGEIVRTYNQAKRKGEQVKILAELNCCGVDDILTILKAHGVEGANKRIFNKVVKPAGEVKVSSAPPAAPESKNSVNVFMKDPKVVYEENKEVTKLEDKKKMKLPAYVLAVVDEKTKDLQRKIKEKTEYMAQLELERAKLEEEYTKLVVFLEGAEVDG